MPARLGHSKMTIDRQFETMMRAIINNLIHWLGTDKAMGGSVATNS